MTEFELIQHFFTQQASPAWLATGVGDDGAVLNADPRQQVVVTDTLLENVHFFANTAAHAVGHKALAVNLSDLAAMGAEPRWITLNLTLPKFDEDWLAGFAKGLYELANAHKVVLIGGDTTRGPLSITITAGGYIPAGSAAICRSGALVGGELCVLGDLGLAALAVQKRQQETVVPEAEAAALDYPHPQVDAGLALHGMAAAAIDVSDGFLADLKHLAEASQLGFKLHGEALALLAPQPDEVGAISLFSGGDDYALLFVTLPGQPAPAWATAVGEAVLGSPDLVLNAGPAWLRSGFDAAYQSAGYRHF